MKAVLETSYTEPYVWPAYNIDSTSKTEIWHILDTEHPAYYVKVNYAPTPDQGPETIAWKCSKHGNIYGSELLLVPGDLTGGEAIRMLGYETGENNDYEQPGKD